MDKIAHIPGVIVQGRYDMICPPVSAHKLSKLWPNGRLTLIGKAGHALSEAGISAELVRATDQIAQRGI
jgi:proline iminopeptidase